MTACSPTMPAASQWLYFPPEIRLIILETIASQKSPGWTSLASVCREWQHVLEKANFYKLKLRPACLDHFEHVISPRKRTMIRHIYLEIELPRYTSSNSTQTAPSGRIRTIVTKEILRLLSILSTWEASKSLALELNAYSPSDDEYWFKNIYLSSDDVEPNENAMPNVQKMHHDVRHGWVHGHQIKAPPESAIWRLFDQTWFKFDVTWPQVNAVTSLIIRRQFRRCIHPLGLMGLLSKLNHLEHVSYEPWTPHSAIHKDIYEIAHYDAIKRSLPDTVRELNIFEDSYEFYNLFPNQRDHIPSAPLPWLDSMTPREKLCSILASKSVGLQHLSISFMVHAEDLFRQCQSTWSWSRLQSLALTSQLLQDDEEKRKDIETLLCRAGILVGKMPKIQTFAVWNGGKAHACAFIFRTDSNGVSITWRGTWHLELSPRVVDSWRRVASKLPVSNLELNYERIQGVINSHGDAIHQLRLPCQVIEPASLWQIRREACSLAQ